ncbi:hypothetical protein CGZ80_02630 [Rhodopirellula sp. MGV]|nr:hypothetical protein CGZ80_02630 [Rhodopirellula sp. MGV]PNY38484.1 hypothetical protein C2E31_00690 [Rhodopirellula baltica]
MTVDELDRIRQTLGLRYHMRRQAKVIAIGFGIAERGGKLDFDRRDCIIFYVRKKRERLRQQLCLPTEERIRVKRGRQFVEVRLPTDVVESPPKLIVPTGRGIRHLKRNESATAGAVVVWRTASRRQFHWGVLTAGHLFRHRTQVPEQDKFVRIKATRNREVQGRLIICSNDQDGVDAALILVHRQSLVTGELITAGQRTRGKTVRTLESLVNDQGNEGRTLSDHKRHPFLVTRYLPTFDAVSTLGTIKHLLDVRSEKPGTFRQGTSGSLWVIARQASCQQCIGWQSQFANDNFVRGGGQAMATILEWLHQQLASLHDVSAEDIELRLVSHL